MGKRRHREPEYALHIFRHLDERTQKTSVVFLLQTTKEFTNFNYQILLDASLDNRAIQLRILGLRTTPLIMPGVGPARARKDFANLEGVYKLSVTKLDGESNQFRLHISRTQVKIDESPPRPFVVISNVPVELPEQ
ncbi:MAG: hypothetical protein AABZ02_08315 [Bacteroidota bacterium]